MQTNNSVRDEKQAVLSLQAEQLLFASPLHISRFQTFTKKKLQQKAFAHHRARKAAISKLQKSDTHSTQRENAHKGLPLSFSVSFSSLFHIETSGGKTAETP